MIGGKIVANQYFKYIPSARYGGTQCKIYTIVACNITEVNSTNTKYLVILVDEAKKPILLHIKLFLRY